MKQLVYIGVVYDCNDHYSIAVGGMGGACSLAYSEQGIIDGLNECARIFTTADVEDQIARDDISAPPSMRDFVEELESLDNIDPTFGYTKTLVSIKPDGSFTVETTFTSIDDFDAGLFFEGVT